LKALVPQGLSCSAAVSAMQEVPGGSHSRLDFAANSF